jgi:hypothetical protein
MRSSAVMQGPQGRGHPLVVICCVMPSLQVVDTVLPGSAVDKFQDMPGRCN